MLSNKEEFQVELSPKILSDVANFYKSDRSASFPLLSACCLVEFDTSVICHVFMYC